MAIIKKYKAKVEKIENPLQDIYTITFSSDKKLKYQPGQFLHLSLDEYDGVGQWPESRCFSMQSKPADDLISITYAVKGKFTKRMANELYEGKEVWIKLPYGDLFSRGHNKENCVFIAGGTGVTPFLSLFISPEFSEYINPKIFLGFRSKEYNFYNNEIREINNSTHNCEDMLSCIYQDVDGILDIKSIFDKCGLKSTYFISGPPIMIKNFKLYLLQNNVNENKVLTDDWE